ncbi:RiPP maturation radical SAM C-methyltransferase [Thermodesulfobacteriota bacterium]
MKRVLLISMPFASVRYPSPALSLLKSLMEQEGIPCDVHYLNVLYQAFTGRPDIYEGVADFLIAGEWVFGRELFGPEWAQSERGKVDAVEGPLLPGGAVRKGINNSLENLRKLASPFIEKCLQNINWDDYGIVGFTSVFSQQVASLALARQIKARWPEKIIAFGGANCQDTMGKALLRLFPFVDWVFNGEADLSFPQAAARWINGNEPDNISGVTFRQNGRIIEQGSGQSPEMDTLPHPDFSDYFHALNSWAPDFFSYAPISLELSRGCWWGKKSQCIFCGLNCKSLKYRRKSPQRAEEEIKTLTRHYKVDKVILTDSILDMSFFKTLLPALAEWGGLEELFLESRSNLNIEQVRILKSAGVTLFQPGVESLDSEILDHMHKGTTLLQNVQFLKFAREYGLYPTWNLLYGFPGENPDAYHRMASLIPSIVHLSPPMDVSPVQLVRFSPLLEQHHEWGLKNVRAHAGYRAVYPFAPEDLNELACFFDADFEGKQDIPNYIDPLKRQVYSWKKLWEQSAPPSLTFERQANDKIFLFDTRPGRRNHRVKLEGLTAIAYTACESAQPFEALAQHVSGQMGDDYSGDTALRQGLDELVSDHLMLKEDDKFLSLAFKPGRSLEVSEEW